MYSFYYKVSVTITPFGLITAGEEYTLECSTNGASASFQWFYKNGSQIISSASRFITTLSPSSNQLRFAPLHQSYNGNYTCTANTSDVVESKYFLLSINGIDL